MEEPSEYYDEVYRSGGSAGMYTRSYRDSPYFRVWSAALPILEDLGGPRILDVGCGVGQFAELLFDSGFERYTGLDFSAEAVRLARQRNPRHAAAFHQADAYTSPLLEGEYEAAVLFEFLEHVSGDTLVLGRLRPATVVVLSVPNFLTRGHVRRFADPAEIHGRYGDLLDFVETRTISYRSGQQIFVSHGVRRGRA